VLVAAGKICKISDFGLARYVHEGDAYHKISKGPGKIAHQYFGTIYRIHFTVLSFFLYCLATNFPYENLLLFIHSSHVYKQIDIWGREERTNLKFSPTSK